MRRSLSALAIVLIAVSNAAIPAAPHPRRPVPPARPAPPSRPGVGIGVIINTDIGRSASPAPRTAPERGELGVIAVAPGSPALWDVSFDMMANSFELAAPLSLPGTIKSSDIASVTPIFNDKADASSVGATTDADFTRLTITGRAAPFELTKNIILTRLVLVRTDGGVLTQYLYVGLAHARNVGEDPRR